MEIRGLKSCRRRSRRCRRACGFSVKVFELGSLIESFVSSVSKENISYVIEVGNDVELLWTSVTYFTECRRDHLRRQ